MDNASLDLASREILTLITPGYRPPPTYSSWLSWLPGMPPFTMTAVDAMRRDYQVKLAMAMKVVPVMKPQFGISGDPQIVEFVESELRSIWTSCITDITEAMWYTRFGCEMVYKRADDGMVRFCRMMPFHPRDFHILTRQGEITGLKVIASNNTAEMDTSDPAAYQQGVTACENDKAIIFAPKSFVYVHNRKFGSYEGCSELEGAFQPWMEKVREGGAISSRSLWFYKCAFDSGIIKHPPGMYVSESSGVQVPYRDIALKVGESVRNGATIALESTYDASGHPAWDYVRAQANQGGDIILQLIDHLDGKINKGAGIPDDVIEQVSGTGSYAGRTIPFIAFLEAGTPTVRSISKELVRQVLMPLAQINFGESRGKDWEITEAGVNTAEFLDDGDGIQGDGDGDGIPNEDMIPGGEDNSGRGVPQQTNAQSQGVQQMSLSGEDRQKLNRFRRQFSSKSVSFVREGRAAGRTQVQVQFSVADEPFSLKREKSKKFVPKNSSSQQTDLFGDTKLTHSPADAFVKKQAESLDGQKDLFSQKLKPAEPSPQEHSAKPQSASTSEGRWITIGGHGEDGKGVHVQIGKDGRIQKGPAGIVDKKISDLSDDKGGGDGKKPSRKSSATDNEPHQFRSDDEYAKEAVDSAKEDFAKMAGKESGDQLSAKDSKKFAQQKYITAHQNAQDEARIHGVSTHDVLQVMPQAYEFRMEQWKATEPARQYAMKATGMTDFKAGGIENKYRDYSTVPEFDERSRSVAVAHPELGLDPQGHDTPAKIWDLIRSGGSKKPKMEDRETAYIAADWIAQAKLHHKGLANSDNGDPDEDTSFDFGANVIKDGFDDDGDNPFVEFSHGMMGSAFDPLEHPRGDDGKFIDAGRIQLAKGDPRVARDLREQVTGASEVPKLEKMLGIRVAGIHAQKVMNNSQSASHQSSPRWGDTAKFEKKGGASVEFTVGEDDIPYVADLARTASLMVGDYERPGYNLSRDLRSAAGEYPTQYSFAKKRGPDYDFGITGTGNAAEVMNKVQGLLNDAMNQIQPKMINFSAAEPSRKRLYTKLLSRAEHINPNYIGYIMASDGNDSTTEFMMVKKDVAEKVKEAARANGVEMIPISSPQTQMGTSEFKTVWTDSDFDMDMIQMSQFGFDSTTIANNADKKSQ